MNIRKEILHRGYYANGPFMSVLEEIIEAQTKNPGMICYLQPYDNNVITQLRDLSADKGYTWQFYASTSTHLSHVAYVADIVGWEYKKDLSEFRLNELNNHIKEYQPGEKEVYAKGVNPIAIKNLRRFTYPIPKALFLKIDDNTPYAGRPLSGGYGYVHPLDLQNHPTSTTIINQEILEKELSVNIAESKSKSLEKLAEELKDKPKLPKKTEVLTPGFIRSARVIAYALKRANGICELCNKPAPFHKPDGTPYLEVHHWIPLADGGEDTIKNAAALCPNCHKEAHFGINSSLIRDSHTK